MCDDHLESNSITSVSTRMIKTGENAQLTYVGIAFVATAIIIAVSLERVRYRWWLLPGRLGTLACSHAQAHRHWPLRQFHWALLAGQAWLFLLVATAIGLFIAMLAITWTGSRWGDFVQNRFSGMLFCGSCVVGVLGGRLWYHNAITLAAPLNLIQRKCYPTPVTPAERAMQRSLLIIGLVAGSFALLSDAFLIPFGRCSAAAPSVDEYEDAFCAGLEEDSWRLIDVSWPLSGSWVPMTLNACFLVAALYFADLYIHASHDIIIEAYSHRAELQMRYAGVHSNDACERDDADARPKQPADDSGDGDESEPWRAPKNNEGLNARKAEQVSFKFPAAADIRPTPPHADPPHGISVEDLKQRLVRYRWFLKRNFMVCYAASTLVLIILSGMHTYFTSKSYLFFECAAIFLTDLLFMAKFWTSHVTRVFIGMEIHVGGMEATPLAVVLLLVRAVLFSTPSQAWFIAQSISCFTGICYLIWILMPSYLGKDTRTACDRERRRGVFRGRCSSRERFSRVLAAFSREIVGALLCIYFGTLTILAAMPQANATLHFATRVQHGVMVYPFFGAPVPLWEFGLACILLAACFALHKAEALRRPRIPDCPYLALLVLVYAADVGFALFLNWSHLLPRDTGFLLVMHTIILFPAVASCVWAHHLWVSADYVFYKGDRSRRDFVIVVCFIIANLAALFVPLIVNIVEGIAPVVIAIPVIALWSFVYGLLAAQCWCNTLEFAGNQQLIVLLIMHVVMTLGEAVLGSTHAFVSPALVSAIFVGTLYHDDARMTPLAWVAAAGTVSAAAVTGLAANSIFDGLVIALLVLILSLWVAFFVAGWQPLALQPSIVPVFVVVGILLFMLLKFASPFVHFCLLIAAASLALVYSLSRLAARYRHPNTFTRLVLSSSLLGVPAVLYTVNQKGGDLRIHAFGKSTGATLYLLFLGQVLTYLCSAWLNSNVGTVASSLLYCVLFVFVLERSLARLVRFRRNFVALQLKGLETIFEATMAVAVERSAEISQQAIMASWLRDERSSAFSRDAKALLASFLHASDDGESGLGSSRESADSDEAADDFMTIRTPTQLMQYYAQLQAAELENEAHSRDSIQYHALFDELLVMCTSLIHKSGIGALPKSQNSDLLETPWLKQEAKDLQRPLQSAGVSQRRPNPLLQGPRDSSPLLQQPQRPSPLLRQPPREPSAGELCIGGGTKIAIRQNGDGSYAKRDSTRGVEKVVCADQDGDRAARACAGGLGSFPHSDQTFADVDDDDEEEEEEEEDGKDGFDDIEEEDEDDDDDNDDHDDDAVTRALMRIARSEHERKRVHKTFWSDPDFPPTMESICGFELGLELDNHAPVIEEDIVWCQASTMLQDEVAALAGSRARSLSAGSESASAPDEIAPASATVQVFDPLDVVQGAVGDCWLLSAISVVALWPELMERVLPSETPSVAGRARARLFVDGEWRDVEVDEYLPCLVSQSWSMDGTVHHRPADPARGLFPLPLFCRSRSPKVVWPMLLEKAFAKTYGSYETLRGGHVHAALVDLTGGLTQVFQLQQDLELVASGALWKRLKRFREERLLLTAGTEVDSLASTASSLDDESGITAGHAYAVLDVVEEVDSRGRHCLLKLRDPWGTCQWKGRWRDQDESSWTRRMRKRLRGDCLVHPEHNAACDFWMSMEDFVVHFKELYVCRAFQDHDGWHHARDSGVFRGYVRRTIAASSISESIISEVDIESQAGVASRKHDFVSDQFSLRVMSTPKRSHAKVFISITQVSTRGEEAFMTLALLNNTGELVTSESEVRNRQVVATAGAYRDTREVSFETSLPCSDSKKFTLLPSLYTEVDVKFTINVYSDCNIELKRIPVPAAWRGTGPQLGQISMDMEPL